MIAALALVLAAAPPSAPIEIAFRPATGSRAAKSFTVEHALALQSFRTVDDGVEQSSQQEIEVTSSQTLRAVDEYRALGANRPALMRRLYDGWSFRAEILFRDPTTRESASSVVEAESPLAGTGVRFTWIPEEGAYGRFYDEKDGIEEQLALLRDDLDYLGLLPPGPVEVGASWTIEPARIADVVAPGGVLPKSWTTGREVGFLRALNSGLGAGLENVVGGAPRGTLTATLAAVEGEGDARRARIAIVADVAIEGDQTAFLHRNLTGGELAGGTFVEEGSVAWRFDGRGELVWDLAQGRFETFRLSGSQEVATEIALGSRFGAGTSRQSMRMKGGLKITAEASAAAR